MSADDLLGGLVVAGLGLVFLVAAPALARLQAGLLEWQLAWVRGRGGPWFWRAVGLMLLAAALSIFLFAARR